MNAFKFDLFKSIPRKVKKSTKRPSRLMQYVDKNTPEIYREWLNAIKESLTEQIKKTIVSVHKNIFMAKHYE